MQCAGLGLVLTRFNKFKPPKIPKIAVSTLTRQDWAVRLSWEVTWTKMAAILSWLKSERAGAGEHFFIWMVNDISQFVNSRLSSYLFIFKNNTCFYCLSEPACVCLEGSVNDSCREVLKRSCGCKDVFISESQITLAFPDRIECWDLQRNDDTPSWSMDTQSEGSG